MLIGIFIPVSIISCRTSYETISPQGINKSIQASDKSITKPEELMRVIYPYSDNQSVEVSWKKARNKSHTYIITLIHSDIKDDSIEAYKYVVTAERKDVIWRVIEIKRAHKCRRGRGHINWGTDLCH
ncbi:MAG: hypothetical protein R6U95_09530 [Bacteroidales bacterium]